MFVIAGGVLKKCNEKYLNINRVVVAAFVR